MRLADWEQRLSAWIVANRDRPFAWGTWDCALAAFDAAAAITGEDRAAEFRGQYDCRKGSAEALRRLGKGTLIRTINAKYERRPVGKARRGDLVWHSGSVGVCVGGAGLFVGEERLADAAGVQMREGLITVPRKLLTKAWTV
jgi:hypothetical protein